MATINFHPGESYSRTMNFTQNGSLYDITGQKVFFTVKSGTDSPDSSSIVQKSFTQAHAGSAVSGLMVFSLNGSETSIFTPGSYHYDFKFISGTGNEATQLYTAGPPPLLVVYPRVTYSGAH